MQTALLSVSIDNAADKFALIVIVFIVQQILKSAR